MGDLISRKAAIDAINRAVTKEAARWSVEELPSAQKQGKWVWDDEGFHCSECGHHAYGNTGEVISGDYKFCPNCGAVMERSEE